MTKSYSHGSIQPSAARVDESSHNGVQNKRHHLTVSKAKMRMSRRWPSASATMCRLIVVFPHVAANMGKLARLHGCLTCTGRLSIKDIIPKVTNRKLVKMKARMALVSFWTFLSLFGGSDWLKGTHVMRLTGTLGQCKEPGLCPLPSKPSNNTMCLGPDGLRTFWLVVRLCSPPHSPSSSSP